MFENIKTVGELNAAWGAAGRALDDKLNAGESAAENKSEQDALDAAYRKRNDELIAAQQLADDNAAIAAAKALGFNRAAYATSDGLLDAVKSYSALKLAGLPVNGPRVDAAIAQINHVSEVLTTAQAAYERLNA